MCVCVSVCTCSVVPISMSFEVEHASVSRDMYMTLSYECVNLRVRVQLGVIG